MNPRIPLDEPTDDRPAIAVFSYRFLARTMTFTHRQLLAAERSFRPIVLTTRLESRDLFPFDEVHLHGFNPVKRVLDNVLFNNLGRVGALSRAQLRGFEQVARAGEIELIHAHFGTGGIQALPLARALGVPLIVTFHGYDASKALRFERYRRSLEPLFEYADIIVPSRYMAQRLVDVGAEPSRIDLVRCGVSTDSFCAVERPTVAQKFSEGAVVEYIQVGSFAEKKGHSITLEAFARLAREVANVRLTFVGGGGKERTARRHARSLGIEDRVRFAGWVRPEEIVHHLKRADVFLHHSVTTDNGDQEGIPVSIIEAMGTGLPVISTRHAGIPELVRDGVSGRLVAERDVEAYAGCLKESLSWGAEPGRAARRAVELEFGADSQSSALCSIYERVRGGDRKAVLGDGLAAPRFHS